MNWRDVEEIAEALEENYPDEEIDELKLIELQEMIESLSEFEGHDEEPNKRILEEIKDMWLEIREGE